MPHTSIKNYIIPLLNLIFILALILSLVGFFISPASFVLPIYFVIAFPILLAANIFFVIFWLVFKKWYFIVSLIFILLSYNHIYNYLAINILNKKSKVSDKELVIVSYNTHLNGKLLKYSAEYPIGVFKYLLDENPDVICIQEYFVAKDSILLTQEDVNNIFKNYPYKYIKFEDLGVLTKTGLAVISKYPIINTKEIDLISKFNGAVLADIVVKNDTIRFINCHLESNRFLGDDLVLAQELTDQLNPEVLAKTTKIFSQRLNVAYPIRALQADKLHDEIKKSPYPVIVCGDFNDVPNSYVYTRIKHKLNDAFIECGNGLGWTFNSSIFKSRIDYIFYDDNFEALDFQVGKTRASDHFPIKCVLKIK